MNFLRILLICFAVIIPIPGWCNKGDVESIEPFQPFEVQGVQLIIQDKEMACWFASAMMLLNWKERFKPESANSCTAIDQTTIDLYKANNGIPNSQIIPLAKRLGLIAVPPMSPTVDAIRDWLRLYGPLWTNGKTHIVVITGIRKNPAGEYEVKVFDPSPNSIGISWRTLAGWYTGFNAGLDGASSRDTSADVEAVFLHVP